MKRFKVTLGNKGSIGIAGGLLAVGAIVLVVFIADNVLHLGLFDWLKDLFSNIYK